MFVIQVAAANREVEATNAKRAQESERSLQALRQKAADDYTKQVKLASLSFALGQHCCSHAAQLCAFIILHSLLSLVRGMYARALLHSKYNNGADQQ